MSKITGIISAALGLALVKRFTDSIKDEPTTAPIIPKQPKQMVLGPAGGTGFDIFPQGVPEGLKITQQQLAAFVPQTPEQQAFTRERLLAPSGTKEQAQMLIDSGAIRQGKIKRFGTGVDLADLLARQTPRK